MKQTWLQQHMIHLFLFFLSGGGTIALVVFKDSLIDFFTAWYENRTLVRSADAVASGRDDKLTNAFIGLLKSDLESQSETRKDMAKAIKHLAGTLEKVLTTQRVLGTQISDVQKDIQTIKTIVGRKPKASRVNGA